MTDTGHPHPETQEPATTPPAGRQDDRQMDGRMMWAMMIGCCLAIPVALIMFGAGLGGPTGASPWLIGVAVVLAIALVITRHGSRATHRHNTRDHHE